MPEMKKQFKIENINRNDNRVYVFVDCWKGFFEEIVDDFGNTIQKFDFQEKFLQERLEFSPKMNDEEIKQSVLEWFQDIGKLEPIEKQKL